MSGRRQPWPGPELERLLARQNRGAGTKPILEINMRHPLVAAISGAKDSARIYRFCCWSRRKSRRRTAGKTPPRLPTALNQLVLRGVGKETG